MGRAPCCDKASVKKGPWSPEEDAQLKNYIDKYGTGGNWITLPAKIGLKRCGKSCRLRWLNYLRPNIKHGGFTEEEDNIISSLYISIGSRWSIIAAQLPGRTDNHIKNYWNTKLKKKLLGRRKRLTVNRASISSLESNNADEENDVYGPGLQNMSISVVERLQLHMKFQNLKNSRSSFSLSTNPSIEPSVATKQNNEMNVGFNEDELEDLSNYKSYGFVQGEVETSEKECPNGSKDNMGWFYNELESSSSSWGSPKMMHYQSDEVFQDDYIMGYDLQYKGLFV